MSAGRSASEHWRRVSILSTTLPQQQDLRVKTQSIPPASTTNPSSPISSPPMVSPVLHLLLSSPDYDIDPCDNKGWTPLHIARLLLDSYSTAKGTRDQTECTPLHHATVRVHSGVVETLLWHGVDINCWDGDGWAALHYTAKSEHAGILVLFLFNTDRDARENGEWTVLDCAAIGGHLEVGKLLGADVEQRENDESTPLHLAARRGHEEFIGLLQEQGAEMDVRDKDGRPRCIVRQRMGMRGCKEVARGWGGAEGGR